MGLMKMADWLVERNIAIYSIFECIENLPDSFWIKEVLTFQFKDSSQLKESEEVQESDFDIFLCYADSDIELAKKNFKRFQNHNFRVFFAEEHLKNQSIESFFSKNGQCT